MHRDVKSQNVFLTRAGEVKLGDYFDIHAGIVLDVLCPCLAQYGTKSSGWVGRRAPRPTLTHAGPFPSVPPSRHVVDPNRGHDFQLRTYVKIR